MNPKRFFAELKRRNVYKVAVAYAVVAWLLIQIATQTFPFFEIPNWAVRLVILLVLLGFSVALVLAWAFELTPEGIKRAEEVAPNESISGRTGRKLVGITMVLAVIAASLMVFQFVRPKSAITIPSSANPDPSVAAAQTVSEKSIAVLPLENLSDDKENAFFADGIQDDILGSLAKIKELKVISRSSVMSYRDAGKRNLREIGQQLGVVHILEGSVRRASNRVLVNVNLVDTRDSRQVWAERYDRTLADSLTLQGELATEIAAALRATLSPEEKARVETKPTDNPEAYLLYLRAREFQTRAGQLRGDTENAAKLLTEAIELDPSFALARARLSATLAFIYQEFQPTTLNRDRARAEAEEALRLRPELGEAHLSRALCLYRLDKNYDDALRELALTSRLLPNDSGVESTIAYISRRRGQWNEARAALQRILARDPRNGQIAGELLFTDYRLRDWAAAVRSGDRAVALAPERAILPIYRHYVDFWSRGDLGPLRAALAAIPPGVDPDGSITLARWDAALIARDFDAAERVVAACPLDPVALFIGPPLPKNYLLGLAALARGDSGRARLLLEQALPALESEAQVSPQDPWRHAYLGLLYSYLGRRDDAIREGRRAVVLRSESQDALEGPLIACLLALILARTDEVDEALTTIERLLTIPAAVDNFQASITLSDLRMRWQWDPLRGDPRFQKILAGPEPKTVYH